MSMAEPVTFKNPFDLCRMHGANSFWVLEFPKGAGTHFHEADWDMEVTFTRKRPEIKVGDEVKHKYYSLVWKVLAIYQDRVWVLPVNPLFGTIPSTRHLDDLRPA